MSIHESVGKQVSHEGFA